MEIINYPSSNGLHGIKAAIWRPEGDPRAMIQIAHGMCEYVERYGEFAEAMAAKGYLVCANDHAGHGDSYKDLRGYFGDKDGHKCLIADMRTLYKTVQDESPTTPYFLLGHSMGSFLARYYCAKFGRELAGAIFSGTGQFNAMVAMGMTMCETAVALGKGKEPAKWLAGISEKSYNKRIAPRRSRGDWLSRNDENVDAFMTEPKAGFHFTYSGYLDMFRILRTVTRPQWAKAMRKDLPVLFFSGDMDPVGEYGKGVREAYEALRAAGCRDVTLKLYPEGRHEMLNEINRAEVYEDVAAWVESRL